MEAERHYCLVKIAECKRDLIDLCAQLPKAKAVYDKYKGGAREVEAIALLQKSVNRMFQMFITLIASLRELEDDKTAQTAAKLYAASKRFDYINNGYEKLCGALKSFADSLPDGEANLNAQAIGRLMNRVKMGYFPTDLTHVSMIQKAIVFPETEINLLDPCSGCGMALAALAENRNAVTYGIELDEYRASESEKRLDRVGYGSFFHSRISHDVFHCVFLNPPYLSVITEGGGSARLEKRFLADVIPHLMVDGLLIYVVPYYRMSEDICRVLCDNFTDIAAYRFSDGEFKKFRQIVIFAKRKKRSDGAHMIPELQNRFINPEQISYLSDVGEDIFSLPTKVKSVELFKGAVFNVRELERQLEKSSSTNALFDASRLENAEKHPPLPLNVSQIGLVGGSGMMNGLVECDTPHIIKGRVIKQSRTEITKTEEKDKITSSEIRVVTSNRMIFNLLTPDGFKSLT